MVSLNRDADEIEPTCRPEQCDHMTMRRHEANGLWDGLNKTVSCLRLN